MEPLDKLGMGLYGVMLVGEWEVAMGKLVRETAGRPKGWSYWQCIMLVLLGRWATVSKGPLVTLGSDTPRASVRCVRIMES